MRIINFKPPWLSWPAVTQFIYAYEAAGVPICFYGGAVRDGMLGKEPNDFDVSAAFDVERSVGLLTKANIPVESFDAQLQKIKVNYEGKKFDIFCTQKPSGSVAEFIPLILRSYSQKDDFSINKLHLSPLGDLYDPVGGIEDVYAGRIRLMKNPELYLINHHNILRLFRFISQFGMNVSDMDIYLAVCGENMQRLGSSNSQIPYWYVYTQLPALLKGQYVVSALNIMQAQGLLKPYFHDLVIDTAVLRALHDAEAHLSQTPDFCLRLAALLLSTPCPAENFAVLAELWGMSKNSWMQEDYRRVSLFIDNAHFVETMPMESHISARLRQQVGNEDCAKLIALGLAMQLYQNRQQTDNAALIRGYWNAHLSCKIAL